MKIKDYKLFLESNNKEEIDSICKKYNIRNYIINDDFTIDVDGCVDLSCRKLTEFPLKVFYFSYNTPFLFLYSI